MRIWLTIGSMALATPVAAQQPCAVPAGLKGFTTPISPPAGMKTLPALPIGRAVRVPLSADAKLPVTPGKAPAAGTKGGAFGFQVTKAGRYRVAVDQALWIDLAGPKLVHASVAHGHAPACSGARKMVDFDLGTGFHVVQLSGAANGGAVLMVSAL